MSQQPPSSWGQPSPPPPPPPPPPGPGYGPPPSQGYQGNQGYGPPGYGAQPPPSPGINGMAIASLICAVTWTYGPTSLLAIIFGLVAKRQIRERGQSGGALATAGIVIGSIGLFVAVVLIVILILAAATEDSIGAY